MRVIEIAIIVKFDCLYTKIKFYFQINRNQSARSRDKKKPSRSKKKKKQKLSSLFLYTMCLLQLLELKLVWLNGKMYRQYILHPYGFSLLASIDRLLCVSFWTENTFSKFTMRYAFFDVVHTQVTTLGFFSVLFKEAIIQIMNFLYILFKALFMRCWIFFFLRCLNKIR